MKSVLVFVNIMVLSSGAFAEIAEQNSWSGDSGVWGPVLTWGDDYHIQLGCYPVIGILQLSLEGSVHVIDDAIDYPRSVFAEDVNGDGFNDVICVATNTDDILWWENDGTATGWTIHVIAYDFDGVTPMHASDIDGDGDIDIIAGAFSGDEIAWWENDLGTGLFWTKHTIDQNINGPYSVYSTDLDGDGDIDILAGTFFGDTLSWWENIDGAGTEWGKHTIQSDYLALFDVYAEDMDGDGDTDVIGVEKNNNHVIWWENADGSGTSWIQHIVDDAFYFGMSVHAGDLDGDGDMDLIGAKGSYYFNIYWWENIDGAGTEWGKHLIAENFENANLVFAADADGDGDLDVLGSANNNDICLAWWENTDGTGSFYCHPFPGSFHSFNSVYAEDLNGDGDLDILATSITYDCVIRWDLGLSGWLESSVLDTESSPEWGVIDWEEVSSTSGTVNFQVRSSASPDSSLMGEWSEIIYEPCSLEGILNDGDRYVQYKAILETTCVETTPVLHNVSINWFSQGISGEHGDVPCTFCLDPVSPNPVRTAPSVVFALPEKADVSLMVYNMAGRVVEIISFDGCPAGWHTANLSDLEHGVYSVRMISDGISMNRRFVVLE